MGGHEQAQMTGKAVQLGMWALPLVLSALVIVAARSGASTAPEVEAPRSRVLVDRLPGVAEVTLEQLQKRFPAGAASFSQEGLRFREEVRVTLGEPRRICLVKVALYNSGIYRLKLLRRGEELRSFILGPRMLPIGLCPYAVDVCSGEVPWAAEIDQVVVQGVDDNYFYEMGFMTLRDLSL